MKSGPFTGIGDAAVKKATGRDWAGWFTVLEAAGARGMPHAEIAEYLAREHAVRPWWTQMVTVNYEQRVLGRARHEKGGKFEVSVSRVIAAPVAAASRAFTDTRARRRWLPEPVEVRKATPGKSVRLTWDPDGTPQIVAVNLYPKGAGKCQVVAQHGKLPSLAAAARAKKLWAERLAALKGLLESSPPAVTGTRARTWS